VPRHHFQRAHHPGVIPHELYLAWERNNDNPALPAFVDMARLSSRAG